MIFTFEGLEERNCYYPRWASHILTLLPENGGDKLVPNGNMFYCAWTVEFFVMLLSFLCVVGGEIDAVVVY